MALEAGESRRVTLELGPRDFAYFDPGSKRWVVESGGFVLHVALSATEILSSHTVSRRTTFNLAT